MGGRQIRKKKVSTGEAPKEKSPNEEVGQNWRKGTKLRTCKTKTNNTGRRKEEKIFTDFNWRGTLRKFTKNASKRGHSRKGKNERGDAQLGMKRSFVAHPTVHPQKKGNEPSQCLQHSTKTKNRKDRN